MTVEIERLRSEYKQVGQAYATAQRLADNLQRELEEIRKRAAEKGIKPSDLMSTKCEPLEYR